MLLTLYIVFVLVVLILTLILDFFSLPKAKRERPERGKFNPKVLVIVPCRGLDFNLKENLKSVKEQDYNGFKVVAVVDSKGDPAARVINELHIQLVISNYKAGMASGKVKAILTAFKLFRNFDVYVIADSDIYVGKDWLSSLVRPLADPSVGISTAYPRFIPVRGFWSRVKFVWGFVGEGLMASERTRFGWGGSLAFRKSLIDKEAMNMLSNSRYSVSDDICLTKTAESRRLKIAYTNRSQPRVYSSDTFGSFVEWSNRQTALSLLGYGNNLYYGIAFYSAEIILFISGILLSFFISPLFIILFVHLVKSEVKTYQRAKTKDPMIALIAIAMPFIYLVNLLAASRISQIRWRGRKYRIG